MKITSANLNATTAADLPASAPVQAEAPAAASANVDSTVRDNGNSMFGDLVSYNDASSQKSGLRSSIQKRLDDVRNAELARTIKNIG